MPLVNKQYVVVTPAGTVANPNPTPVAPMTPTRRTLIIQNTGANPGLVQFGNPVQNNGSDLAIPAGGLVAWIFPGSAPLESIALGSATATTWAILEGIDK